MSCIYKITNTINGKVYIGQTIKNPKERFREHKYCATHKNLRRGYLYKAMAKYGCDNFTIEVVEKCPRNLLDEREMYWIKQYDSFNNGYNLTLGGGGARVRKDTDEILSLWDSGLAISDIANEVGCDREHVSIELKASGITDQDIHIRCYKTVGKKTKTPVYQYDLQGNFIAEFSSVYEASEMLGINWHSIRGASYQQHQVAGEFQWRTYKVDKIGADTRQCKTTPKKVYCLETDTVYRSMTEAQEATGVDRHIIKRYIDGKRKDEKYHFTLI